MFADRWKHLNSQRNVEIWKMLFPGCHLAINSYSMTPVQVSRLTFQVLIIQMTIFTMHFLAIVMLVWLNLYWTLFFSQWNKNDCLVSSNWTQDRLWCVLSRRITTLWKCTTSLMLFSLVKNRFLFKVCFIKDWQEKFVVSWCLMNINE